MVIVSRVPLCSEARICQLDTTPSSSRTPHCRWPVRLGCPCVIKSISNVRADTTEARVNLVAQREGGTTSVQQEQRGVPRVLGVKQS